MGVIGVGVGEDLPQYLAILELIPGGDSAGQVEGIDLWVMGVISIAGPKFVALGIHTQSSRALSKSGLKSSMSCS